MKYGYLTPSLLKIIVINQHLHLPVMRVSRVPHDGSRNLAWKVKHLAGLFSWLQNSWYVALLIVLQKKAMKYF